MIKELQLDLNSFFHCVYFILLILSSHVMLNYIYIYTGVYIYIYIRRMCYVHTESLKPGHVYVNLTFYSYLFATKATLQD